MLFKEFAREVTEARGIRHPDDIAAIEEEMRLGWDAAMQSMGGTFGSHPDQVRVVKLRTAFYLLEQDVRAFGHAEYLALIHKYMKDLGLDYVT